MRRAHHAKCDNNLPMNQDVPTRPSNGATAASVVLSVIAGLLWVLSLATLASLGDSDAAGNAIGEAYAAIQIIALWSLLTILTIMAGVKGTASKPAIAAALIIVPASGFVAMAARRRRFLTCAVYRKFGYFLQKWQSKAVFRP